MHRALWSSRRAVAGCQGHSPWGKTGQPAGPLFVPQGWSQAGSTQSPFSVRGGSGKTRLVARATVHLSSSPQAEVPTSPSSQGHCTHTFRLHSNAASPGTAQGPGHQGRPWGGEGGRSCRLAGILEDGGPLCENSSSPRHHGLQGAWGPTDLGAHHRDPSKQHPHLFRPRVLIPSWLNNLEKTCLQAREQRLIPGSPFCGA